MEQLANADSCIFNYTYMKKKTIVHALIIYIALICSSTSNGFETLH